MSKRSCGCGNPKGEHEITCKTCWREVPHVVKRKLSVGKFLESEEARRQILLFCTKRRAMPTGTQSFLPKFEAVT